MRTAVITAVLATALIAAGCGDRERLENELASANARLTEMDSTLAMSHTATNEASRRADSLSRSLRTSEASRDSLAESLKSAKSRAGRLEGELKSARAQFARTVDSLNGQNTVLMQQVRDWEAQMQNAEAQIASLQEQSAGYMRERDSLYAFVDDVKPWYDYYKQESRRNWLKKIFGAGRGKKPVDAEPVFAAPTARDFEAHRP